ncbi:MAG: BatA domain-containing protein [Verrucomicrobiota bacterium]
MSFLQPLVLWGLPLVLLPVIIHLINRLRHRSQSWAAMQFLISATQNSISQARLRQLLVLLFRVLAVLMLILFLSRPLAGGWLGWVLAPAPDVIVVLLDRSASMEARLPGTTVTRREQALKLISQAAHEFEETSHLVLLENALRAPQEVAGASSLASLSLTTATDTAADLPAMLQSALNWLIENRAGTAEIWIASDLQRSNWKPEEARWKSVVAQLSALPQTVRVRLLAVNQEPEANAAVSVQEVTRRQNGSQAALQFVLDFQRNVSASDLMPLTVNLDGASAQLELAMDGQAMRWRHKTDLGSQRAGGWGSFELPADANPRDNSAFFVFGPETPLRARVVSRDAQSGRFLELASATPGNGPRQPAERVTPAEVQKAHWEESTLLVWQESMPTGAVAEQIRNFVEEGGVAVFFPPAQPEAQRFHGLGWGEVQTAASADKAFRVLRWDEDQGPLAKTDEGLSLPLAQVVFLRRQAITGQKSVLAAFEDGAPFLVRQTLGRGEIFFCAGLPHQDWSSLGDGPVLVPMLQRLLQAGSRRLQQVSSVACGEMSATDQRRRWASVDAASPKDFRFQAGVYRSGERMVAVNRPALEDEPEVMELGATERLFGNLPFQMLLETRNRTGQLQGEIWRFFLSAMLIFLVVEAMLILPQRQPQPSRVPGRPLPSANGTGVPEAVP